MPARRRRGWGSFGTRAPAQPGHGQGEILRGAMSQENVEIVRRAFAASLRDGLEGLMPYLDPEIEWTTTGAFLEAATYRGHAGVRRYLGSMEEEFEDLSNQPEQLIDAGDQVFVRSRVSGRGKRSGAPVELVMHSVSWVRDSKIVRIRNYLTRAEALEAAGLSE
jgi:ketosteroid isomerase-like protein